MFPQHGASTVDVFPVFGQICRLVIKEVILLETSDFQGNVEELGNPLAGDDLFLHQSQFEKRRQRQTDHQGADDRVAENDFPTQGIHRKQP